MTRSSLVDAARHRYSIAWGLKYSCDPEGCPPFDNLQCKGATVGGKSPRSSAPRTAEVMSCNEDLAALSATLTARNRDKQAAVPTSSVQLSTISAS